MVAVNRVRPEVVFEQADRLARDLAELTPVFDVRARAVTAGLGLPHPGKVYLVGSGDSYHAGCSAEMAFESIAGMACEPMSSLRFLEYGVAAAALDGGPVLVVLTSASGETERVVQCAVAARRMGARTVAVVGVPDCALSAAADATLMVEIADRIRSPGIRTYQASLLGLLLLAVRLAAARGQCSDADALAATLAELAGPLSATNALLVDRSAAQADRLAAAPTVAVVGSGPGWGCALFGAAKLVETAGVPAVGVDTEEWCHVELLARPADLPVVVVAPPGRSLWRAGSMAAQAAGAGRWVVAVVDEHDDTVAPHAAAVLPVRGSTREEFSPLLYHLFACHLAGHVALRLGRAPFLTDRS